ncbi:MAG: GNAT family N-acetyltransferase [Candidatus Eisenbacteria bacterium]|nr:GNAT family N-acetyltransferase [Candidatus Eisenbacteria bacterium]MCC7142019.1 GNAT family N-acetyltransferase [Candidatus Eisenbacteria bacterium]
MATPKKQQSLPLDDAYVESSNGQNWTGGWGWRTLSGGDDLSGLHDCWDDLRSRVGAPFFAGPEWLDTFVRGFGQDGGELRLHALFQSSRCVAVLPLRARPGIARVHTEFDNEHWPFFCLAFDARVPGVAEEIVRHLLEQCDLVDLSGLHENAEPVQAIAAAARSLGLAAPIERLVKGDTFLRIPQELNGWTEGLSRHLQRDITQGRRRLERSGAVRLEVTCGGPDLAARLDEAFALEARGWKAESGTPIDAVPSTHRFYRELAAEASRRGAFALYQLRLDDRLIAFEYCLRDQRRIDLLKISYDPAWARVSPGTVLRGMILEREIALREVDTYHFGRPSEWKLRWTDQVAPLVRLSIYARGWRGQLANLAYDRFGASLRRSNFVRRASRWMRSLVQALPF